MERGISKRYKKDSGYMEVGVTGETTRNLDGSCNDDGSRKLYLEGRNTLYEGSLLGDPIE